MAKGPRKTFHDSWQPTEVDGSYQPTGVGKPNQAPVDIGGGPATAPAKEKPTEAKEKPVAPASKKEGEG